MPQSSPPSNERNRPHGLRAVAARSVFGMLYLSIPKQLFLLAFCFLGALLTAISIPESTGLEPAARRALFILVFAATLWLTDAMPAFAVGILIISLRIALLGRPGGVFARTDRDWETYVVVLGDPLIWLFFGGFVLAAGMSRTGLDRWMASHLLGRFATSATMLLLGVMLTAFLLSMFMSNTATTAMILAMIRPIVLSRPENDRLATGLLLSVAVAANIGGMGSLIGTPPNAVAVGILRALPNGPDISFLQWLAIGFPLAAVLLVVAFFTIHRFYFAEAGPISVKGLLSQENSGNTEEPVAGWQKTLVAVSILFTIGLWVTGHWHGLPTPIVSFVPIVVFTSTGILREREFRNLPFDVLFLLAGGLALGQTVTSTGLSTWLVAKLPTESLGPVALMVAIAFTAVAFSNLMSNTAAANVLIPLGVTMAAGFESQIAVSIAVACSAAMCLPVATPPNAMVYATERVKPREFLRIGLLIGLLTPLVCVAWTSLVLGLVLGL
jgi:solute carrier family 13 (sodium-dependent dicarboxylate transporter), member 2/3/5